MSAQITIRQRSPFDRKWARIMRKTLRKSLGRFLTLPSYDNLTQSEVDAMIQTDPMAESYVNLYTDVGVYFAQLQQGQFKSRRIVMDHKDGWTDIWAQQMQAYALGEAGARITWVTETTRETVWNTLRTVLNENRQEGISATTDKIQKELSKRIGSIERWRAMRIAQTEVLTASNRGGFVAAKSLGIPMVKSWTTGGKDIRPTHIQAQSDNVSVQMDKPFIVAGIEAMMPGDPALPAEEVINCKCGVIYDPV